MSQDKAITDQIISSYETNLFSLREKYQYHWALRRYRLKKDSRLLQPILSDFQRRCLRIIPKINRLGFFWKPKRLGKKMLENYSLDAPKKTSRYKVYQKFPEVLFYCNLSHFLFLLKTYRLSQLVGLDFYYHKGICCLKKADLKNLLLKPEVVEANPSQVANSTYYLKFLKITDFEQELLDFYRHFWLAKDPQTEVDWQNKIYGLTHLVIAASYFYQRFLETECFGWILDYFEKEIDQIIKYTNPDIVAEVGLCFKLCQKQSPVIEKTKSFVMARFDKKLGFIPREKEPGNLEKAEHRNAIAILLLSDFTKLNSGPDLLCYMQKKRRSLFLPRKGTFLGPEPEEDS